MFLFMSLILCLIVVTLIETCNLSYLMLLCIFFVFHLINSRFGSRIPSLLSTLLLLQFTAACVFFSSTCVLYLFISYEFSLLPMSFVILLFGYQPEKLTATLWFLVYLAVSGLPLFLWVVKEEGSLVTGFFDLPAKSCFLVSLRFMFKTPLYTLHL